MSVAPLNLVCRSVLLLFAVLAVSCTRPGQGAGVMSDSLFVEVMSELIKMKNPEHGDTTYETSQRAQTLEKHKVTLATLEDKGRSLAKTPTHAATVWGKIRLKATPVDSGG